MPGATHAGGGAFDWHLEGAGSIEASDDPGLFAGHPAVPKEEAGRVAVTYTDFLPHKIGRNLGHLTDDITIGPGQTWCVITSAVEGESRVTATAPEINVSDSNHAAITQRWLDAEWTLPPAASGGSEAPLLLSTRVFRQSNSQQGLPDYRVRYRILDGPPAQFVPGLAPDVIVTADPTGAARIRIALLRNEERKEPAGLDPRREPGRNRIAIEILAPADGSWNAGGNDLVSSVLGQAETTVDWQPPAVSLRDTVSPTVNLGQEVTVTFTLSNTGPVPVPYLTLHVPLAEGMSDVRLNPNAENDGKEVVWTLLQLPSQARQTYALTYKPARVGSFVSRAQVTQSLNGVLKVWDERLVQTEVLPRPVVRLQVEDAGPASALLVRSAKSVQSIPLTHQVTVSNPGTDAASNVRLRVELPPELEHISGRNPLEWSLGNIPPGDRRTVALDLRPAKRGVGAYRLTAVADGQVQGHAEAKITVRETGVSITMSQPAPRYVGKPFTWDLSVTNNGTSPLVQVTVGDLLPPELDLVKAENGGQLQGREVVWVLDRLNPGETRKLQLTTQANRLTHQAINKAQVRAAALETENGPQGLLVSSAGGAATTPVSDQAEATVQLQGLPAIKLRLAGQGPLEVGDQTAYTIDLVNTGSLAGAGLQVVCTVPPEMRVLSAVPGQYRLDGTKLTFAPLAMLAPGQALRYVIHVLALTPGDARFRAELTTSTMQQPHVKENSIHIVPKE